MDMEGQLLRIRYHPNSTPHQSKPLDSSCYWFPETKTFILRLTERNKSTSVETLEKYLQEESVDKRGTVFDTSQFTKEDATDIRSKTTATITEYSTVALQNATKYPLYSKKNDSRNPSRSIVLKHLFAAIVFIYS